MKELRVTLEEERAAEHSRLENQRRRDIERLKAELEEELQEERRKLLDEKEEKLNSLKQEVTEDETDQPGSSSFIYLDFLLFV